MAASKQRGSRFSDAFTEDDAMDMPQAAPVEPATASSPTAAPTPVAAASEPATALNTQEQDEARRAHEAAEAKRKAEWDDKQAEKRRAERAAAGKVGCHGPDGTAQGCRKKRVRRYGEADMAQHERKRCRVYPDQVY